MKKIIVIILAVVFIAIIGYSGFQLMRINENYSEEAKMHDTLLEFKPEERQQDTVNQNIIDLQKECSDAVGWLTIPDTKIDYPFVWYKDNDYYLRRNINGKSAFAGTVFMDYRCNKDFTSQNTIIYGHHMKNGSMFGTLKYFNEQDFFNKHKTGTIFLPRETLTIEFFAYVVLNPNDEIVYTPDILKDRNISTYLQYVQEKSKNYRNIDITDNDRIVTISTCAYEWNNARMVLIGKIRITKE